MAQKYVDALGTIASAENQKVILTNKNVLDSLINYPINMSTTAQYIQELNLIMQFLALHPNRM